MNSFSLKHCISQSLSANPLMHTKGIPRAEVFSDFFKNALQSGKHQLGVFSIDGENEAFWKRRRHNGNKRYISVPRPGAKKRLMRFRGKRNRFQIYPISVNGV